MFGIVVDITELTYDAYCNELDTDSLKEIIEFYLNKEYHLHTNTEILSSFDQKNFYYRYLALLHQKFRLVATYSIRHNLQSIEVQVFNSDIVVVLS